MIVMIDNYDSFTYNLVQMIQVTGTAVEVVRNDDLSADELLAREPAGIVISPGPGRPEKAGICVELVQRRPSLPILGVCLGHQVIACAFGGQVERAPELMHGKTSQVRFAEAELFAGLPNPFQATRYHSLSVPEASLPEEVEALAWSEDGTLMGLRHRQLPYWGVQFHPESVLSHDGPAMMGNFLRACGLAVAPAGER